MKFWKKMLAAALAGVMMAGMLSGCADKSPNSTLSVKQLALVPEVGQQIATIKVKDYGDIKIMLFPEVAPKGVENFVTHAQNGYYDGLKFHRVIEDFMAQTGDPNGDGTGGESIWGEDFELEVSDSLHHFNGAVAYANSGPNTNGSQFYLVYASSPGTVEEMKEVNKQTAAQIEALKEAYPDMADQIDAIYSVPYPEDEALLEQYSQLGGAPWLDGSYTIFGQIYEGMDVLAKIMASPKDSAITDDNGNNYVPSPDILIETIEVGVWGE